MIIHWLQNRWLRLGAIAIFLLMLVVIFQMFDFFTLINSLLEQTILWVDSLGTWGIFAFILIYIVSSILFLSGAVLTLGAGALFGVVKGSILVSIASTLAATCAFLVGRYGIRNWVAREIETQPKFKAIDKAVAQEGWKVVGLVRLSPLFPFVFLNYAFGVTQVSLRDYVIASWIGMMPGTVMYVYFGAAGKAAANAASSTTSTETLLKTGLTLMGLAATVIATVLITKTAQQTLNNQIALENLETIQKNDQDT